MEAGVAYQEQQMAGSAFGEVPDEDDELEYEDPPPLNNHEHHAERAEWLGFPPDTVLAMQATDERIDERQGMTEGHSQGVESMYVDAEDQAHANVGDIIMNDAGLSTDGEVNGPNPPHADDGFLIPRTPPITPGVRLFFILVFPL